MDRSHQLVVVVGCRVCSFLVLSLGVEHMMLRTIRSFSCKGERDTRSFTFHKVNNRVHVGVCLYGVC